MLIILLAIFHSMDMGQMNLIKLEVADRLMYMGLKVTASFLLIYFPYMEGTKLGKGGLCHWGSTHKLNM